MKTKSWSWAVGVYGGGTGATFEHPCYSGLRFASQWEAQRYGEDLLIRWTQPTGFVTTKKANEPANCVLLPDGRRVHIGEEE